MAWPIVEFRRAPARLTLRKTPCEKCCNGRFRGPASLGGGAFADCVQEYERLEISWEQFRPLALPWLLVKFQPITVCVCNQSRAGPDEFRSADSNAALIFLPGLSGGSQERFEKF